MASRPVVTRFSGPYEFLSNFHRMPDGTTLEHHYQAAKTHNEVQAQFVMNSLTPAVAKRRGRAVTMRPDWEEVKRDVMLRLLRARFEKEPYRSMLLATDDAYLEEGNTWHDQYWGSCTCTRHWQAEGQNWLGKLLMQVREELRGGPSLMDQIIKHVGDSDANEQ